MTALVYKLDDLKLVGTIGIYQQRGQQVYPHLHISIGSSSVCASAINCKSNVVSNLNQLLQTTSPHWLAITATLREIELSSPARLERATL